MVAVVMIGIDPHKGSHTAVALAADEARLGQIRVRASAAQLETLRAWAASWTERIWAIRGCHRAGSSARAAAARGR
jgi:transposase